MTQSIGDFTETSSATLTPQELLQHLPAVLLGVGPDATTELAKLGISTVSFAKTSSAFSFNNLGKPDITC